MSMWFTVIRQTDQLRALRKMPYFDEEAIRECMMIRPNYTEKDYEYELKDDSVWQKLAMSF